MYSITRGWAAGASGPDDAAHASRGPFITSGALSSSTAARSQSMYSFPVFDCTAFLERLDGRVGNGRYLNCSDCASIVATFANAVGATLAVADGAPASGDPCLRGEPNPCHWLAALGDALRGAGAGFIYHEVA